MSTPFDATTKRIFALDPPAWLVLGGLPRLPAQLVDADLSTVTSEADRVLKVLGPPERLFHFEFESGRDASQIPRRLHRYNVLVDSLYGLPVASIVFLLNPQAGRLSEVTGYYKRVHPDTGDIVKFWYRAVRVWELPVSSLLTGGVAILPLALLTDLEGKDPADVVAEMHRRVLAEVPSEDDRETVLTSAYIIAGLRFSGIMVKSLFAGVLNMEESSTYQEILSRGVNQGLSQGLTQGLVRGRAEEARRMILLFGEAQLGVPPAPPILEALDAIAAPERLEDMARRIKSMKSWDDLLRP